MNVISLGYRTDLMLRTMAGSNITELDSHVVIRTLANPGFWWGNFLLLKSAPRSGDARRLSELFTNAFPEAAHLALGVDNTDGDCGEAGELADLGVTAEVNTVLTATRLLPPGQPRMQADIRALISDDDWEQALDLRINCDDQFALTAEHRQFLERKFMEHRRLCEAGFGAWIGAFVEGRMRAGAGLFSDGQGLARFQGVETHPSFRRQGLASAVVHHAGHWGLHQMHVRLLVIVADPGYHAIHIYRALGFEDVEQQVQLTRADPSERVLDALA
ncbi:GNAT family N-acetyltransferase [Streptomyces sp. NPDC057428]|uniref:GNAT family N-acetyltransferase n=1 Tax=Streptomyces sp. NPDC057428 TaxID=3346129 RepID=UPI0036918D5F